MIRFECDYNQGCHPLILEKLAKTNFEQTVGYGEDQYCANAKVLIKEACGIKDIDIHFLVGGTQTNTTVISSVLKGYQGVISADTGHINTHETGAIEATGHKVLSLPNEDGKIKAAQVAAYIKAHYEDANACHTVQPAMVYISFPTENGTLYSKAELEALYDVCQTNDVCLFIDGARLGYGLAALNNDLSLRDICRNCDIFYIGGTKVGALFGEAVVIVNDKYKKDFRYNIKRHGGMLAKGRLLGIQFETLFTDDLYYRISKNAIDRAMQLKQAFQDHGYKLLNDSYTNQQFVYLNDQQHAKLQEKYAYSYWGEFTDGKAYRFCTSWATSEQQILQLINDLKEYR
ncbi:MAG: low specificity L-threonine aldolase [Erysipelotrichaceae bacterium]|nr:low specificity L-threonine aldolase [Erysipelotrichaceae bacterium]MDY5252044.1 low specificity L-threonine aldolase [Erysipelotrichaceae bacterium]